MEEMISIALSQADNDLLVPARCLCLSAVQEYSKYSKPLNHLAELGRQGPRNFLDVCSLRLFRIASFMIHLSLDSGLILPLTASHRVIALAVAILLTCGRILCRPELQGVC
jgi:hypothetical protein